MYIHSRLILYLQCIYSQRLGYREADREADLATNTAKLDLNLIPRLYPYVLKKYKFILDDFLQKAYYG